MLSRLQLPPGFTVRIDYDPDQAPLSATLTIFRAGQWVAEISDLQEIVDIHIRRGVHLTLEGHGRRP